MARTTYLVRVDLVRRFEAGQSAASIASELHISRPTVYKWLRRHRGEGLAGLRDRPPVAKSHPRRVPAALERRIEGFRRRFRMLAWEIGRRLQVPRSTVIRVLKRLGLSRLSSVEMPLLIQRYEYANPGELVHIDIKKLGRIHVVGHRIHGDRRRRARKGSAGWEHVYVCVDDATRLVYVEAREREDRVNAREFLSNAARWFAQRGIRFQRVMTDNGKVFTSHAFRDELAALGAVHQRTAPYTPRQNGKAERFIRTLINGWAYAVAFETTAERRAALPAWIRYYNEDRPHSALKGLSPALELARRQQGS